MIPGVRPRPFPYPFQAGLAMASDIDRCDPDTFIRVHRYLNGPPPGLGLPVSDSFFGVGRRYHHMAYFNDDGRTPSPEAELIRQSLAAGLIDTLHSWGAFDKEPPNSDFLRRTAEHLTARLTARGLRVPLWSNHGAPTNHQNLLTRTEPRFAGDDPASPYYSGDLLQALGVQFFWSADLLPWPTSCHRKGFLQLRHGSRLLRHGFNNGIKRLLGRGAAARRRQAITHLGSVAELRDGRKLIEYCRFNRHPDGIWGRPTRHTLRHSLHPRRLAGLIAEQGYLIVYTHLGMPAPTEGALFPPPDAEALAALAGHYHAGRIWVAPTAALLQFWRVMHYLQWSATRQGDKIIIRITAIDDPATGPRPARADELAGLCFYTPCPGRTMICLEERPLATVAWPADAFGHESVGLAVRAAPEIAFLDAFQKKD